MVYSETDKCRECNGWGWTQEQVNDKGDSEQRQCQWCNGTGIDPEPATLPMGGGKHEAST